jgi:hypothetical protein
MCLRRHVCLQTCFSSGEATNTNFIVFGLTRLGLEPTICCTRGKHANHYTTDAIVFSIQVSVLKNCIILEGSTVPVHNDLKEGV